jgi:hypothetical protein
MTALPPATLRRLLKLPQTASVWEGDRRSLGEGTPIGFGGRPDSNRDANGESLCILWADGSQGMVRSMDMVSPEVGQEAVVRALLRALEYPHEPASPARPQKIIVRDREIQFYLRSLLQDLNITLEYVPELPLIDEIFRSFQKTTVNRPPMLPPAYDAALMQQAEQLWAAAPWEQLGDHQIIEITLNRWDLGSVYASMMGMLGMEYGLLLYRSVASLQQFRQRVMTSGDDLTGMEEAFLAQDCLFLTYEVEAEIDFDPRAGGFPPLRLVAPEMTPMFGSLHPLEGLRPFLYDDEAAAMGAILEALLRFVKQQRHKFGHSDFPAITSRYKVPVARSESISIKVSTLPDLSDELLGLVAADADDDAPMALRDDLVPHNAFLSLGVMPWEIVKAVRLSAKHHQPGQAKAAGDGLPVVVIQTSQPKAKALIEALKAAGGLAGIGFNPGSDELMGDIYDLGILKAEDGELHLFGEYNGEDPTHINARKKWDQRCKKTKGYCGLVVAKGISGASRGNPKLTDMLALFEGRSIEAADLGMGLLEKRFKD